MRDEGWVIGVGDDDAGDAFGATIGMEGVRLISRLVWTWLEMRDGGYISLRHLVVGQVLFFRQRFC
jgi:hypothetical protein